MQTNNNLSWPSEGFRDRKLDDNYVQIDSSNIVRFS